MKFITIKDLASEMKKTREIISKERAIITYNGKPIAIINPLNEQNFEFVVNESINSDFKKAVIDAQKEAKNSGLKDKDVQDAVKAARKTKKAIKK